MGFSEHAGVGYHRYSRSGSTPGLTWSKMQLSELMHNMGMHVDTLALAYADGVYHIRKLSPTLFS